MKKTIARIATRSTNPGLSFRSTVLAADGPASGGGGAGAASIPAAAAIANPVAAATTAAAAVDEEKNVACFMGDETGTAVVEC